jgi:hypothetical protein
MVAEARTRSDRRGTRAVASNASARLIWTSSDALRPPIDTNIMSEVRKGSNCDPQVAAWYDSINEESIYLSVLVLGEIRKGVERARPKNPAQARALERWLANVSQSFAERVPCAL